MAMKDTAPFQGGEGYPASHYHVGDVVTIQKYGCLYPATVVKVGKTTLTVNFKPQTAPARDFTFPGRDVARYVRPRDEVIPPFA